jgi:hypothetical protein
MSRCGWFAVSLFIFVASSTTAGAEPPAGEQTGGFFSWPSIESWKMPKLEMSKPKQPAFVQATRDGLGKAWTNTKRTTKSVWNSTVHALRPYDPPAEKQRSATVARRDADAGFWSKLFGGGQAEKTPMTVNEFLRQPAPY